MLESLCSLAFHFTDKNHPYEIASIPKSNKTKQQSTYIDLRNFRWLSDSSFTMILTKDFDDNGLKPFKNIPT